MPITRLNELLEAVKAKPRRHLVAAAANDLHTLEAVAQALEQGLVEATLVGDEARIRKNCVELGLDTGRFTLVHEPGDAEAAAKAVELVRGMKGAFLKKGALPTETLLRALLDKEKGLAAPGSVLSHVSLMECPGLGRLLVISDPAVILQPDLAQKIAITKYVIQTAQLLGIAKPRVALLGITEFVNPKMASMIEAAAIAKMADRGQIQGAFVDGPMALDVAIDAESAKAKGVSGEVAGRADGLVFPNIDAGNVFYKACTKLAGAEVAGLVMGARVPCVVTSRGDSSLTKLYSIALAALAAEPC